MRGFAERILRALGASPRSGAPRPRAPRLSDDYPGDFTGVATFLYRPDLDGEPDPGEIVWAWVPYEEDFTEGKDRPVLLIGRDGKWLLGLPLSSKNHHRDADDEARHGRFWLDVGRGKWDAERRPSEVRLDRILRVNPHSVRREGAVLDRGLFQKIARAVRETKGW